MRLNLETDFEQAVDGLEPVELRRRESGVAVRLEHCLRRGARTREGADSNGHCQLVEARWHLDAGELMAGPQLGDTIIDGAGTSWTIQEASLAALGTRWVCRSRALVLGDQFPQRITIERAVVTRGAHGEAVVGWQNWMVDVPARIQPMGGDARTENDQRLMRASHTIYLAESIELTGEHRVVHGSTAYQVIGYRKPERLGDWFAIEAVVVPWVWSERRG